MTKPRGWGFWTRLKLDMLREYLPAFTRASKSVGTTTYLDLFAGQVNNVDRETGDRIESSVEIALRVDPLFTSLRFFERDHAKELAAHIKSHFRGSDSAVIEGDANETIHESLTDGSLQRWAPTFAFIDPDGPDCWWTTLETLARFKERSQYKTELWMLFPVDMFTRFLRVDGGDVRDIDARRISDVFGTQEWQAIYEARRSGDLQPTDARFEYVNLMRWRLEHVLGYQRTHSFDFLNTRRSLYSMIFATDNAAGDRIMSSIYSAAARQLPEMAEEARQHRRSQGTLFTMATRRLKYVHEDPLPPFGSSERQASGIF